MRRIFILIVVLIVYGSLFPWYFHSRVLPEGPVLFLLRQWDTWNNSFLIRDIVINLVLYSPLGATGYLTLKKQGHSGWWVVPFGLVMSFGVELAQVYAPGRMPSTVDFICNTLGTTLGAGGAALFWPWFLKEGSRIRDTAAWLLSSAWLLYLFFPFIPVGSRALIHDKVSAFARSPLLAIAPMAMALAMWFARGLLLHSAGSRRPRWWLVVSLAAIPAWLFIADRRLVRAEVLGALLGVALFCWRGASARTSRIEAWGFLSILALRAVWPARYVSHSQGFSLIPFQHLIRMDGQIGLLILLGQICWYGTAMWLLRESGMRIRTAALVVVAVAGVTELADRHIAGMTPGITAPLVALLSGYVIFSFSVTKAEIFPA